MALISVRSTPFLRTKLKHRLEIPHRVGLKEVAHVQVVQVATLKLMYGEKYPYSKPYPYKKHRLGSLQNVFENTGVKLDEQSKIVSVEGVVGVGKHDFAKRIAKEFDLLYVPGIHDDDLWAEGWNMFDVRKLNEAMPAPAKAMGFRELYSSDSIDLGRAARLQARVMEKRLLQYSYSCLHLLSTGQGFVTVRSPYSDQVFCDAMWQMGWVSGAYAQWHRAIIPRLVEHLLPPHLVIYLDASAKDCVENVKRKEAEDSKFVGGKNIDEKFLRKLAERYRRWIDRQPTRDGEVLQIDWTEAADESEMEMILEVISNIKLDSAEEGLKYYDWTRLTTIEDFAGRKRVMFGNPQMLTSLMYEQPPTNAAEFYLSPDDYDEWEETVDRQDMVRYRGSALEPDVLTTMRDTEQ